LWPRPSESAEIWSFRSSRGGVSRPDHAFSSPGVAHLVLSMRFSQAELDAGLSDHAPMVLELRADLLGR
jgi:hypothetical protein